MRVKIKYVFFAFIGLCFLTADALTEPNMPDPTAGRPNPFAKFQLQAVPVVQKIETVANRAYNTIASVADKPPLFVETMVIKFLEAQNLKNAIEGMLSPAGSMAVDKNSNSLIICDSNESVQRIVSEIRKVDVTPQLLQIEVVIVDVQLDNDTEVGVNWDFLS